MQYVETIEEIKDEDYEFIKTGTIIISPFSKPLRNGKKNPKDYPFWSDLIFSLGMTYRKHDIIQIGKSGEEKLLKDEYCKFDLSFADLLDLTKKAAIFISVDNFYPHFCHYYNIHGMVIFSQSNPELFGYKENYNLLKDLKYLRSNQHDIWEATEYVEEAFVRPEYVLQKMPRLI